MGGGPRRHQSAQAHGRRLRRPRASVVARRDAHRVLLRPRRSARQQLQHLDARGRLRRARAAHDASGGGFDAELVGQRCRHRVRLDPRRRPPRVGGAVDRRPGTPGRVVDRHGRCRLVESGRPDRGARHRGPVQPARGGRRQHHRQRERVPVPSELGQRDGVLLHGGWQDPQARARRRIVHRRAVHGDAAGHARCRQLHPRQARLRLAGAAQDARSRAAGAVTGWREGGVCRRRRHLGDAGGRRRREHHQGSLPRYRSGVVARRHQDRLLVRQGRQPAAALDPRSRDRPGSSAHHLDHAAAGRHLVERRHEDRVLRRRRHVAACAGLGRGRRPAARSRAFTTRSSRPARPPGRPMARGWPWRWCRATRRATAKAPIRCSRCRRRGGDDRWFVPEPNLSIDSRGGGGVGVVARRHQDGGASTRASSGCGRCRRPVSRSGRRGG